METRSKRTLTRKEKRNFLTQLLNRCRLKNCYLWKDAVKELNVFSITELENLAKFDEEVKHVIDYCKELCFSNADIAGLTRKIYFKDCISYLYQNDPEQLLKEYVFDPGELEKILGIELNHRKEIVLNFKF